MSDRNDTPGCGRLAVEFIVWMAALFVPPPLILLGVKSLVPTSWMGTLWAVVPVAWFLLWVGVGNLVAEQSDEQTPREDA